MFQKILLSLCLKIITMKRLLPLICVIAFFSCSKTMDTSYTAPDTIDRAKPKVKTVQPQLVYTSIYQGSADASYGVSFPPFKVISGQLISWKILISRKVYGTVVLTNTLNAKNDSALSLSRYTQISVDTPYYTLPNTVVKRLKQSLRKHESVTLPLDVTLKDSILSDGSPFLNVYGLETPIVQLGVRDLINVFKPNCQNVPNLSDSTTVTMIYYYTPEP